MLMAHYDLLICNELYAYALHIRGCKVLCPYFERAKAVACAKQETLRSKYVYSYCMSESQA